MNRSRLGNSKKLLELLFSHDKQHAQRLSTSLWGDDACATRRIIFQEYQCQGLIHGSGPCALTEVQCTYSPDCQMRSSSLLLPLSYTGLLLSALRWEHNTAEELQHSQTLSPCQGPCLFGMCVRKVGYGLAIGPIYRYSLLGAFNGTRNDYILELLASSISNPHPR